MSACVIGGKVNANGTLFPVVWARNFGLKQVEQQPALKDAFMAQANGLSLLKDTRYAV